MLKAGVFGAAGYAGIECVRILAGHPGFELAFAASDSDAGKKISEVYPSLTGHTDIAFESADVKAAAERCDVVFLAVPHTASLAITPELLGAGCAVIDISADYRLKNAGIYEEWYGVRHSSPELLDICVYGLPEDNRSQLVALRDAHDRLVACAGCYPTASALAALPLLHAGLLEGDLVVSDCISGVSGAGRGPKPGNIYCTASENANAYGVATHRHTPEIAQTMSLAAGRELKVAFTPHLAPLTRGLLSTVYLPCTDCLSEQAVRELYLEFFEGSPFVRVLPSGEMPKTSSVRGSNEAHVGIAFDSKCGLVIASCAIDNLMKGAAGQAVQCANIICGLEESAGLVTMLPPVV